MAHFQYVNKMKEWRVVIKKKKKKKKAMIFKYSKLLLIIIEKATVIPPIDIGQAHSRRNIRGFCIEYISILLNEEERGNFQF